MVRQFDFQKTEISGLVKITPFSSGDHRGCTVKDFSKEILEANGLRYDLAEELLIKSHTGVLRGLHFQRVKQPAKMVYCVSGRVWDVVVDLRRDSPSFKKWLWFELDDRNQEGLLIPGSCATGFLALEPSAVLCKCSEKFYAEYDGGIRWDDPEIGVEWPLAAVGGREKVILSEKDRTLPSFEEFMRTFGGL